MGIKKTEMNERCPFKGKYCDRMCAWRLDDGCSVKVIAVLLGKRRRNERAIDDREEADRG